MSAWQRIRIPVAKPAYRAPSGPAHRGTPPKLPGGLLITASRPGASIPSPPGAPGGRLRGYVGGGIPVMAMRGAALSASADGAAPRRHSRDTFVDPLVPGDAPPDGGRPTPTEAPVRGRWVDSTLGVERAWVVGQPPAHLRQFAGVGALACVVLLLGIPISTGGARPSFGPPLPEGAQTLGEIAEGPILLLPYSEPGFDLPGSFARGAVTGSPLSVLVTLPFSNRTSLNLTLSDLVNPSSPRYQHFLSQTQFDERFGGSPAAYAALVEYIRSFGVHRLITYADRASIWFSAPPGQVSRIFHTQLREFEDGSLRFYAPVDPPGLPAGLAGSVIGVQGLSDFSSLGSRVAPWPRIPAGPAGSPAPGGTPPPKIPSVASTPCANNSGPFNCTTVDGVSFPVPYTIPGGGQMTFGSELQVTYDEMNRPGTGIFQKYGYPRGASIATIGWSNPLATYAWTGAFCSTRPSNGSYAWDFYAPDVFDFFNYTIPAQEPKPHPFSVALAGSSNYSTGFGGLSATCDSNGNNGENTLDLDMAGSLAPGANLYQVFGQGFGSIDTAFADILNPARSDGPGFSASVVRGLDNVSVISNSLNTYKINDSGWFNDLQEAQVRGMTVLAATGDSGTNDTAPPADQAYDDFGDVAVGGTTLTLNPRTLLRSPLTQGSNPYTVCNGTTTWCGGEIGWFETFPQPNGSNFLQGSTGGTTSLFPEPVWQKRSPDADSVILSAGGGRGEPDLAAVANTTLITLTDFQYSSNVTDLNFSNYGSPLSTAADKTGGTSGATPVEAGVIASVDAALYSRHHPWVGFIDPQLYSWGQQHYNGTLTTSPTYDVTRGNNSNYSALPGYDLVTGWGPLDASNFARLELTVELNWTNVTIGSPTSPMARQGTSMTYDSKDGYVVLFGGYSNSSKLFSYRLYNDTWEFQGGIWTNITKANAPSPRFGAAMAYDAKDRYVVLYGGDTICPTHPPPACFHNDTWKFAGGVWTNITPSSSPPPRLDAGMTYDIHDKCIVLFGGELGISKAPYYHEYSDTWEFVRGFWTNVTPPSGPSGRRAMGMTYDGKDGYIVLFGGEGGTSTSVKGDTWKFAAGIWTNISSTGAPSPRASWGFLTYDARDRGVVLFGGCTKTCTFSGDYQNDTWLFVHGSWTNLTSGTSPPPCLTSLVFDPVEGYVILFSGYGTRSNGSPGYLEDTWTYR
jgi:hypothetical protein